MFLLVRLLIPRLFVWTQRGLTSKRAEVKPENVLYESTAGSVVKLADFDMCCSCPPEQECVLANFCVGTLGRREVRRAASTAGWVWFCHEIEASRGLITSCFLLKYLFGVSVCGKVKVQKDANLKDLVTSFPTNVWLRKSASMKPRTILSRLFSPQAMDFIFAAPTRPRYPSD